MGKGGASGNSVPYRNYVIFLGRELCVYNCPTAPYNAHAVNNLTIITDITCNYNVATSTKIKFPVPVFTRWTKT
jgi:hypothetical protein